MVFIGAVLETVNECEAGNSPPGIGGVAALSRKRCEATASAQTGWSGLPFRNAFLGSDPFSTTPSAPLKELRDFFLMSRPPLLCQEGSGAPNSFKPSNDRALF